MKCEDCKYYYKDEITKTKQVYSALQERDVIIEGTENIDICGFYPNPIKIDKNRVICSNFIDKNLDQKETNLKVEIIKNNGDLFYFEKNINKFLEKDIQVTDFRVEKNLLFIFYEETIDKK